MKRNLKVQRGTSTLAHLVSAVQVATWSLLATMSLFATEIAYAGAGDLFATDAVHNSIVVYALDGSMRTFATGLDNPQGLAFDQFGNLFVADKGSGNIYKFTADGTRTTVVSGLADPVGVAFPGMALAVSEEAADQVVHVEPDGSTTLFTSIPSPGDLNFTLPNTYVLNPTSLTIIDENNNATTVPITGGRGIAVDNEFDAFVSTDSGDITRVGPDSMTTGIFASGLTDPRGMAFRPRRYSDAEEGVGNLFVADATEGNIHEFTPDGTDSIFAAGFNPNYLAFELVLPGKLLEISTRLRALTGDNVLIGGFIITGDSPKTVLLRAIGPSLVTDLGGVLEDPMLELHLPDGSVMSNDDWRSDQEQEIEATGIAPTDDKESAILVTLDPGAYTAIVSGTNGGVGIALVEAYDLDQPPDESTSQLGNISTRGFVDQGDNCMIGGFIIDPAQAARVLIRAIGPTLANATTPVPNPLQDPVLELHDGNGDMIASNDDWADTAETEIAATGIAPEDPRESAILANLMGGPYTAIVTGKEGTVGVALVEVYHLP